MNFMMGFGVFAGKPIMNIDACMRMMTHGFWSEQRRHVLGVQ